ncbi:MAG: hypothetical protein V1816_21250 [Pseudomonadota bacterium]
MNPVRAAARRLAGTSFARKAVLDRADLAAFRARPSVRLVLGVLLITIGQVMGLPAVAGFAAAAAYLGEPLVLLGGPVSYLLSWVVWTLGMWLAGPDNIRYMYLFSRWAVRVFVEWSLGNEARRLFDETELDKPAAKGKSL